ncbi:MAG TPA: DUF222 domain-containing protein, partial [Propionibacteriaceae bacterium]
MQSWERLRNRFAIVDHRLIVAAGTVGVADRCGQPSMRQVLVQLLRLSPAEASRRVLAAQVCSEQVTMLGEVLPPARPHLAAAQAAGVVSAEQLHIVASALDKVDRRGFDPAEVDAAEKLLTDFAGTFGAKDLKHLTVHTVAAIDPDGTVADEQLNQDRRHFQLTACRDGMYAGEFRLTGPAGAKLQALLAAIIHTGANSRSAPPAAADAEDPVGEPDTRSYGQRAHDALEDICDRILRAGDTNGTGGTPATVIVTVTLDDLTDRLGYGTTSDGTPIPTAEVLRLANQADILPTVMTTAGAVLTLGRTRRIATAAQTQALTARDHGCTFPGCTRPPQWCERHHITEWAAGGTTDLDTLTLLCRYHHHNSAQRGWTCRLNNDRLPEWTPPRWLDPTQTPILNSRIRAHHD